MSDIYVAVILLCALAGSLAVMLLIAEYFFANYGECEIDINDGDKKLTVKGGGSLLGTLTEQKIFLPSACGGRGSCGFCKCKVEDGAGPVLPTETPYLNDEELKTNVRLSCQIKVKENLTIRIPEEILSVKDFYATVESIEDLTHDIKGIRFKLPEGETIKFKAGQYVQLAVPPYGEVHEETYRAYSMSGRPSDDGAIELVIRLVPNGIVTTYVFEHMQQGQKMRLMGPFGDFYLRDTERECIFIGGGSGLAPFRSMIFDMIEKGIKRKTKFFFGAVGTRDLYYLEEFKKISEEHDWFEFVPALSGDVEDGVACERGLITDVVDRFYDKLDNHEGYLCGSPGMIDACVKVLTDNGMPEDLVYYDKFS